MLSPVIKQMIEQRLGHEIRYPSDCEQLADDITTATRQHIGVTTLKRLMGFVKGVTEPRLSTLDILARYIGFRNYSEIMVSLAPSDSKEIEHLSADDIAEGTRLRLTFYAGYVWLEKRERHSFGVLQSTDRRVRPGDTVTAHSFRLRYPLYLRDTVRDGIPRGGYVMAKVSGIIRIEMF